MEAKRCDACGMEFDWEGVIANNYEYCCEACSNGEPCTCPQHQHGMAGGEQGGAEA